MVGRCLVQLAIQEVADTQRVGGPPGDGPFRVQAFKVPEQQQPEVPPRRQTRAPDPVGIKRRALGFNEGVKACVVQQAIQPLVKRVPRALRQIGACDPHRFLPRTMGGCPSSC